MEENDGVLGFWLGSEIRGDEKEELGGGRWVGLEGLCVLRNDFIFPR